MAINSVYPNKRIIMVNGDGVVTRGVLLDIPRLRNVVWLDAGEAVNEVLAELNRDLIVPWLTRGGRFPERPARARVRGVGGRRTGAARRRARVQGRPPSRGRGYAPSV